MPHYELKWEMSVETLFKNADTAMYWVKEQGRDNYELYWYDGTKTL